ncbi:MAG: DUF2059 domain-containing protein [Candidatus Obscuribacterales bacterium]|nr:DUF2059 domain-containing protein [Steroidobacteraceae bacterium]
MTTVKYLLAIAMLVTAVPQFTFAEELTTAKRADIERLLEMTGATALGKQMATAVVAQMAQSIKQARPDVPQRVIDVLPEEVGAVFEANMASFNEIVIPIYHNFFTGLEIKEMIRFYSTELGKKTIRVMPALMQESMLAGQQWGQSLGPKINERVRARLTSEGFKL